MTRIYRPYPVATPPHGCYTAIVANAAVRHSLDSLSVLVMPIGIVLMPNPAASPLYLVGARAAVANAPQGAECT